MWGVLRAAAVPGKRRWQAAGLLLLRGWRRPRIVLGTLNALRFGSDGISLRLFYAAMPFM